MLLVYGNTIDNSTETCLRRNDLLEPERRKRRMPERSLEIVLVGDLEVAMVVQREKEVRTKLREVSQARILTHI